MDCTNIFLAGWKGACDKEHNPTKEVRKMFWPIPVIAGLLCIGLGYFLGWSSPDWKPLIEQPYVDHELMAKLENCQSDWKEDQITKKLLRMKVKECQSMLNP